MPPISVITIEGWYTHVPLLPLTELSLLASQHSCDSSHSSSLISCLQHREVLASSKTIVFLSSFRNHEGSQALAVPSFSLTFPKLISHLNKQFGADTTSMSFPATEGGAACRRPFPILWNSWIYHCGTGEKNRWNMEMKLLCKTFIWASSQHENPSVQCTFHTPEPFGCSSSPI